MLKIIILIVSTILFIIACDESSTGPSTTTEIYKGDGSKQCEGPGIQLSEMEVELTNNAIDVISSNCGFVTGLSAPAVCGATTLQINIYKININQLDDAKALGFDPVSDLPGYQISDCPA